MLAVSLFLSMVFSLFLESMFFVLQICMHALRIFYDGMTTALFQSQLVLQNKQKKKKEKGCPRLRNSLERVFFFFWEGCWKGVAYSARLLLSKARGYLGAGITRAVAYETCHIPDS